jgi:hypothetical protein
MSKADKRLARMRVNPKDWAIDDLKIIAQRFHVDWRQPGTSHVTFSKEGHIPVTVPAHKPVKAVYVKRFLALIDAIEEGIADEEDQD